MSEYPERWSQSARSTHSGSSSSGASSGATPRSETIVRFPSSVDEGHDDAVPTDRRRPENVDRAAEKVGLDELAGAVRASLADEARLGAERRRPGGDVGGLAAGAGPCLAVRVVAVGERPVQLHDDVQQQVAEGADHLHA